jgi:hypothetical protein
MDQASFGAALTRPWPHGDSDIPDLRAGMIASDNTLPLRRCWSRMRLRAYLRPSELWLKMSTRPSRPMPSSAG